MSENVTFRKATAVWPAGRRTVMNDFVGFRAVVRVPEQTQSVILRVTASTLYRAFVDGEMAAYGPARAAHDCYRVDEVPLRLASGDHLIAIEVAGYNMNSYYVLDQPSFLQAEVVADGKVLAATGAAKKAFKALALPYRVRKVARYSFQRPSSEEYRMNAKSLRWRTDRAMRVTALPCDVFATGRLLPRRVGYPAYLLHQPQRHLAHGTVEVDVPCETPVRDRSMTGISPVFKGYREDELEAVPSVEIQHTRCRLEPVTAIYESGQPVRLTPRRFASLDFGQEYSGFIRARVSVSPGVGGRLRKR